MDINGNEINQLITARIGSNDLLVGWYGMVKLWLSSVEHPGYPYMVLNILTSQKKHGICGVHKYTRGKG